MQLPGRVINAENRIVVTRTLPPGSEILAHPGLRVEALDVIARAEIPHRYRVVDVARQLANPKVDMRQVMLKSVGDTVEANEIIATAPGSLPLLKRSARAPAAGTVTAIGPGWALVETERMVVEVQAFINGIVAKVIPQQAIIIETKGAKIEAACGIGGEAYGRLQRLVDSPATSITIDRLHTNVQHTIVVGGRSVDEATLRQAEAMQVRGIIVGSMDTALLNLDPLVKVRVVATEGFGNGPMSPYTFALLNKLIGREVSIRGHMPVLTTNGQTTEADRSVILATTAYSSTYSKPITEESLEIREGSHVRVTRGKLLGATGYISSMPAEPQPTESGIMAPGAFVTIDNQPHFIPWANLEQIL
jgi:hypothetical protein